MKKSFKSQPWLNKWQPLIGLLLIVLIVKVLVLASSHKTTSLPPSSGCEAIANGVPSNAGSCKSAPMVEAMIGQKALYDKAYEQAKNYYTPESPVRGVILGTTLKDKQELAGFFQRLQKGQHYETMVLLSSAPATTFSDYGYKTPYGILQPLQLPPLTKDASSQQQLSELSKKEAWPKTIAPFIAKSFPDAKIVTVFADEKSSPADLQKLANRLNEGLPEDTLIIAQATSKTSGDPNLAEFQLKFTENVLENFDNTKLATLPLNNSIAVDVLQKYLTLRHAQKIQNQFMAATTGSFISFAMEGPRSESRNIFMVAFGDLMFDRVVRSLMDSHSLDYPFEKMDKSYLKANDILVANLEGPIAKQRIITSKSIAFRFAPDIVPLLQKYFFDALSMANNHARDMGDPGFNDTFDLLAPTGIKVFGDPRAINDRSTATIKTQSQGNAVAQQGIVFLGLEEVVYDIDDAKAVAKIKEITAQGYKVIPFLHWGIEYQHKPTPRQQELAHKFIDAGAVAVIGCHPHVVETYETYKNRPIFYSLGNAIFDQYFSPDTQEGLSTAMIISSDQIEIYFLPIKIDRSQFGLMTPDERTSFLKRFATYGDYATEAERQDILKGKLVIKLS